MNKRQRRGRTPGSVERQPTVLIRGRVLPLEPTPGSKGGRVRKHLTHVLVPGDEPEGRSGNTAGSDPASGCDLVQIWARIIWEADGRVVAHGRFAVSQPSARRRRRGVPELTGFKRSAPQLALAVEHLSEPPPKIVQLGESPAHFSRRRR